MGEVYLAEQVSLGRSVAIKVLRQDLSVHPAMSERFRREALLLSSVDHPAVVRVIEFGHEASSPCLVMELAEGETLRSVLSHGPLAIERALALLCQLLEGLAAIHHRGIVHRDLKPDNVVLSWGPRGEQARLLDFGIARFALGEGYDAGAAGGRAGVLGGATGANAAAGLGGATGTSTQQSGLIVGTPQYLAPEQAMGAPVDVRTDLYTFGILAYETLTGVLPFDGPTPRQFLSQHIARPPRPLPDALPALAAWPEVCRLVMWCLQKEPRERPQTATELLEALLPIAPPVTVTPNRWAQTSSAADGALRPGAPAPGLLEDDHGYAIVQGAALTEQLDGPSKTVNQRPTAVSPSTAVLPAAPPPLPLEAPDRNHLATLQLAAGEAGEATVRLSPRQTRAIRAALTDARPHAHDTRLFRTLERRLFLRTGLIIVLLGVLAGIGVGVFLRRGGDASFLGASGSGSARPVVEVSPLAVDDAELELPPSLTDKRLSGKTLRTLGTLAVAFAVQPGDPTVEQRLGEADPELLSLLARAPYSRRQWGALRFLDRSGKRPVLELVDGYTRALTAKDCQVRAAAATRLGELGTPSAAEALERLRMEPLRGGESCGHAEASAALLALERRGHR